MWTLDKVCWHPAYFKNNLVVLALAYIGDTKANLWDKSVDYNTQRTYFGYKLTIIQELILQSDLSNFTKALTVFKCRALCPAT